MARKSPAFSFYPDSFLGGTLTMSTAEVGIYIRLLAASWLHGQLSFSFCLAFNSAIDSALVERVLKLKFKEVEPGQWINERLEEERKKQLIRSENGKKGGRPKANGKAKRKLNGKLKPKQNESPVSDSDSLEKEDKEKPPVASDLPPIGDAAAEEPSWKPCDVVDCWRHYTGQSPKLTKKRRDMITTRLRDPWWQKHFAEGCQAVSEIDFCLGDNDRGWRANLDWFIRPDSLAKVLEGNYGRYKPKPDPYQGWTKITTAESA